MWKPQNTTPRRRPIFEVLISSRNFSPANERAVARPSRTRPDCRQPYHIVHVADITCTRHSSIEAPAERPRRRRWSLKAPAGVRTLQVSGALKNLLEVALAPPSRLQAARGMARTRRPSFKHCSRRQPKVRVDTEDTMPARKRLRSSAASSAPCTVIMKKRSCTSARLALVDWQCAR
jgi:hypothetical protein